MTSTLDINKSFRVRIITTRSTVSPHSPLSDTWRRQTKYSFLTENDNTNNPREGGQSGGGGGGGGGGEVTGGQWEDAGASGGDVDVA